MTSTQLQYWQLQNEKRKADIAQQEADTARMAYESKSRVERSQELKNDAEAALAAQKADITQSSAFPQKIGAWLELPWRMFGGGTKIKI